MTEEKNQKLNIYQRINAVMHEVQYVKKNDKAAKGLPYKFVSHDQVTGALRGPLTKHGIVVTSDILEMIQDGNRTSVKMLISFVNIDDPKDKINVTYFGQGIDTQEKGLGKAISYCMKMCLLKMFCLETGDDPERDNVDYKPATLTDEQIQELEFKINGHDDIRKNILKLVPGGKIENMTTNRFSAALEWCDVEIAKKGGE